MEFDKARLHVEFTICIFEEIRFFDHSLFVASSMIVLVLQLFLVNLLVFILNKQ